MADAETKKLFLRFEKKINYMYQDSEGNVTIGIGHRIKGKSGVSLIKLKSENNNLFAHSDKKNHDYDEVEKAPKGKPATFYKKYTNLIISDREINRIYEADISEIERLVKHYFPKYDTYPLGVRRVLLDMGFNMGPKGTKDHSKFSKAIEGRDWLTASKSCKVGKHSDRNKWRQDTLMQAYYNEQFLKKKNR